MNLQRLNLTTLSLFTLVVRTGSISQGAALAYLAVGAASKRITDLEAAFGVTLLERHSRGVRTTPAGQVLFDRARSVLQEVEHLSAELSGVRDVSSLPRQVRLLIDHLGSAQD